MATINPQTDPRLSLMVQSPDTAGIVRNALASNQLSQQRDLQNQAIQGTIDQQGIQQQASELGLAQAQDLDRRKSLFLFGQDIKQESDLGAIRKKAVKRVEELTSQGKSPGDTIELIQMLDDPNIEDALKIAKVGKLADQAEAIAVKAGAIEPTESGLGRNKFIGTPVRVERDGETFLSGIVQTENGEFTRVDVPLGGELVSTLGETGFEQSERAAIEAGAKETAKLQAQFKLQPQVAEAVALATGSAKANVDALKKDRSNENALGVYETAMNGLVTALGGTLTGPGASYLPAVTSNRQIADGAIAAMAPVLKQIFRSAGEGTFTDQDQKLLTAMLPTVNDLPDARLAKMANIDAIVRAKLGASTTIQAPAPAVQQAAPQPVAQLAAPQAPAQQATPGTPSQGVQFLGFE